MDVVTYRADIERLTERMQEVSSYLLDTVDLLAEIEQNMTLGREEM